jgi:serine phosphatase RsbU (regulator of sigma subunit)
MKRFLQALSLATLLFCSFSLYAQDENLFWEKEQVLFRGNIGRARSVQSSSIIGLVFSNNTERREIWFTWSRDGDTWEKPVRLVNNFFTNNADGVDFSGVLTEDNILFLAYRSGEQEITLSNVNAGATGRGIQPLKTYTFNRTSYLPRLFLDSTGNLHMLVSQNEKGSITLYHQKINPASGDVIFQQPIAPGLQNPINPMFAEDRNRLQIVFQAKDPAIQQGLLYNIVLAESNDQGEIWEYTTLVASRGKNNQRPFILNNRLRTYLVWEREDENFVNHIYYKSFLNLNNIPEEGRILSSPTAEAHDPSMIFFNNTLYVYWYGDSTGRFLNNAAQVIGDEPFPATVILEKPGRSHMIRPVLYRDEPVLFWVQSRRNSRTLNLVKTDTNVNTPEIRPLVKVPTNRILNTNTISLGWSEITDTSGLEGYRYLLTRREGQQVNPNAPYSFFQQQQFDNLDDGLWYFKIKAYDRAGNESAESVYTFTVDTTPPDLPAFIDPPLDEDGTLNTNSPQLAWEESNEKAAYFNLFYRYYETTDPIRIERTRLGIRFDSRAKRTRNTRIDIDGLDNGTLLVGLQQVDLAGNKSEVNWRSYTLNDYIPVTFITRITSRLVFNGDNLITITGRGYSDGGDVTRIIIDRDKQEPWDYVLGPSRFKVDSDRVIRQTRGVEIDDGRYYLAVDHPLRGLAWYRSRSDFSGKWLFRYKDTDLFSFDSLLFTDSGINLTTWMVTIFVVICLLIFLLLFSTTVKISRERAIVQHMLLDLEEKRQFLKQDTYTERKKEMKRKGMGLTLKYTFLILMLVIIVVSATSVTLSNLALRNERINLAREMRERAVLVMRNYEVTMLDIFTFQKGFTEAVDATFSTSSLPDVGFVMFRQAADSTTVIRYGNSRNIFFKDVDMDLVTSDELDQMLLDEIFTEQAEIDIDGFKDNYDGTSLTYPEFDPNNLKDRYIFVKPIIIESDNNRYVGEIVIGYSFRKILDLIRDETINLIRITLIVTLVAILISIVGAIFLATTTIRPIRKISRQVNVISNTEDYEQLEGTENEKITVTSRDEIGVLADSINDMTEKLIEKAKADKQLLLGKEIQKKFLPLEPHETDDIDIYGFYEGAKGVSGDFFDYKVLDDEGKYYSFIICDVAGKAVPAALIMVQISTVFNTYFSDFSMSRESMNTVNIVNTINDTVAEKGFPGRFAAILVGILNIKTGKMIVTNAGYTQVLIYRKKLGRAEWVQLDAQSGAAGVFPSEMLPNPYVQESLQIDHGDTIMLFSDGIEEARNGETFINENGEETPEEFGLDRIKQIIDENGSKSPKEVINTLIEEQEIFRNGFEQYDDLTIMAIKRK